MSGKHHRHPSRSPLVSAHERVKSLWIDAEGDFVDVTTEPGERLALFVDRIRGDHEQIGHLAFGGETTEVWSSPRSTILFEQFRSEDGLQVAVCVRASSAVHFDETLSTLAGGPDWPDRDPTGREEASWE